MWWLLALVLAQAIGLAHRTSHALVDTHAHPQHEAHEFGRTSVQAHAHAHTPSSATLRAQADAVAVLGYAASDAGVPAAADAPRAFAALFDGHASGDAECRLLDALAQVDPLPSSPVALPPSHGATPAPGLRMACRIETATAAVYDARAPPILR